MSATEEEYRQKARNLASLVNQSILANGDLIVGHRTVSHAEAPCDRIATKLTYVLEGDPPEKQSFWYVYPDSDEDLWIRECMHRVKDVADYEAEREASQKVFDVVGDRYTHRQPLVPRIQPKP